MIDLKAVKSWLGAAELSVSCSASGEVKLAAVWDDKEMIVSAPVQSVRGDMRSYEQAVQIAANKIKAERANYITSKFGGNNG